MTCIVGKIAWSIYTSKMARFLLILLSVLCLHPFHSIAHAELDKQLQSVLEKGLRKHGARGVSAAIVFPDGSAWTNTSGVSHDTVAMQPDMLFAIGSVTKNIMAALVLRLAEESELSLDDSLAQWLPAFQHVDPSITIRQLLNHTSGLYMYWENDDIWEDLKKDRTRVWTPNDVLSYIKEPYFAPGGGWRYSNTNYLLLAMVIEEATGKRLSEVMHQFFWEPMAISSAFLSTGNGLPENMAHVYGDNFQSGAVESDITYLPRASHESIGFGSSGLFMTSKDLALWCHRLFEGQVLRESSMAEMLSFVNFRPVSNMRAYGLGVQLFKRDLSSGKDAIGHAGGNIGSTTYMVYLPEYHFSVVVMVNAFPNESADAITRGLVRKVLRNQGEVGPLPYVPFMPYGFVGLCSILCWCGVSYYLYRRRKAATV